MRATGTGNRRIPPPARAEHAPDGRRPAHHDTPVPATATSAPKPALPVPLTPSRARDVEHLVRPRASAPFIAQLLAQSRPGLSPAREARRRPEPAHDAYRAARALGRPDVTSTLGSRFPRTEV